MNIRVKSITPISYSLKVGAIKKKLSTYTHGSFVSQMYSHFQMVREPKVGVAMNFPWSCFLAMKWKFTTPMKASVKEMNYSDFVDVINRVYDLQVEASSLIAEEKLLLNIRRMIINQLLYQSSNKFDLNSLLRQFYWYCEFNDDSYFKESFFKMSGFRLETYYKISIYLFLLSIVNDEVESEFYEINRIIIHLAPIIDIKEIKAYFNFVGLSIMDLEAYLSNYSCGKSPVVEYYEDTPLLNKPILFHDNGVMILCKKVMKAGFANLIPEILKKEFKEEYKIKFGSLLERHITNFLKELKYNFESEKEIRKIYNKKNVTGKVVDFIITEGDAITFVDCKAIEPAKFVKVSNDAKLLKQRLESSFLKGIVQGLECARILNNIGYKTSSKNNSIIIVVHRDHFIPNARAVEGLIAPGFFDEIIAEYGELPVSPKRIYYMTIDEFELMLKGCAEYNNGICDVISYCADADSFPESQKANVSMHLGGFFPDGVQDPEYIIDIRKRYFDLLTNVIGFSSRIWDGKLNEFLIMRGVILK